MKQKDIKTIKHNEADISITRKLIDSLSLILNDKLGYSYDKQAEIIGLPSSTVHNVSVKRTDNTVTQSAQSFAIVAFDYLIKNYNDRFYYDDEEKIMTELGILKDRQFNNGIYFGYFKIDNKENNFFYFVLIVKGLSVDMWSRTKIAKGNLIQDKHTFSIILKEARPESKNYEFFIGHNSDNPNLIYFTSLWRNSKSDVNSVVCMAKYIGNTSDYPAYESVEAIKKRPIETVKKEILDKRPKFAENFFTKQENKFIKYDITGYEYE